MRLLHTITSFFTCLARPSAERAASVAALSTTGRRTAHPSLADGASPRPLWPVCRSVPLMTRT